MAATVVTRATWTNDTGTPASPVGDGTIINNARLQADVYDKVDQMFGGAGAYATFTFGGAIATEAAGTAATFDGSVGGGGQIIRVRNTSAGAAANAEVRIGNDGAADSARLIMCSTTFTTAGFAVQDGMTILCTRAGGLNLGASHASGLVRLMGKSGCDVGRPAQITSNQTDYTFGGDDSGIYVLTSDASRTIGGLAGGVDGRKIRIINGNAIGSGFIITISVAAGAAGNQVTNAANANVGLNPKAVVDLTYDGTNTVWVSGAAS